ncbi:hypothetical protein MFLAVUS_001607 [Mucor flavus]|uniref:Transcription initiation factor IIF subunit alpha n=1 Tax=Mucor flavus TaxID=439312 RepID=A0ABP9YMY3_9FUNG
MEAQKLMKQHKAQQQSQKPQEKLTFDEFQLTSTSTRAQNHLMDFKSYKKVDLYKFTLPVRLHREGSDFIPHRQYIHNLNEQNTAAAAKTAVIVAGTATSNDSTNNKNVEDIDNKISPDGLQVTPQPQYGPKTGADTSLIAPLGGAARNKHMSFKKRTNRIYLPKDTRELEEQERRPWILEDCDSHNNFNGTLEGGQRSDYMFFVKSGNGFKVVPLDRWYKFRPKRNFKPLASEQSKKQREREDGRWMTLKREKQRTESTDIVRPNKLKLVDTHDTNAGSDDEGNNRQDSDMDDLDLDDDFQDDDESAAEHEVEDEEVRDCKDHVQKEIKDFTTGNQVFDEDYDEIDKLTSEGKQMRKLVRNLEKNHGYESDDDDDADPYASSVKLDSDANDEDGKKDNKKEKKNTALKRKAVGPPSKPTMPKKAHTAKVKKEGKSKHIGRPGLPSLYTNKREKTPAGRITASPVRPSSLLKEARPSSPLNKSSSPSRPPRRALPTHSPPSGENSRKRKMTETAAVSNVDVKQRKISKSLDLITEQEVIDTLRGHPMTIRDFLRNFRKRIRKNDQNRRIVTELLQKLARRSVSADPSTRKLILKAEYQ